MSHEYEKPNKKIKFNPDKGIPVGREFDFWLNEEDDMYEQLYRDTESKTGSGASGRDLFHRPQ